MAKLRWEDRMTRAEGQVYVHSISIRARGGFGIGHEPFLRKTLSVRSGRAAVRGRIFV